MILTFFSYLFSDLSPEHYLAPTIIPIAAVLTYTLSFLYTRFKPLAILVGLIILYSFYNNLSDRLSRPEYWLDNRPIVYQFWFNYLHNNSSLLSEKIVISNVFGPTDKYCRYFLKDCRQIQFRNFDLSQEKPANNTLYLGFNGNFFGKQFKNNFSKTVESDLLFQGFTILESKVFLMILPLVMAIIFLLHNIMTKQLNNFLFLLVFIIFIAFSLLFGFMDLIVLLFL